jgi:hypothetical protein
MKPTHLKLLVVMLGVVALVLAFRRSESPDAVEPTTDGVKTGEAPPTPVALRVLAKQGLARQVAAGRRPLLEAAALFRELDRLPPVAGAPWFDATIDPPIAIPGRTEDERRCQQVLLYVRAAFNYGDVKCPEAERPVADEFFRILRERGVIQLPSPESLESARNILAWTRAGMTDPRRRDRLRAVAIPE